jgi:hypothetical protein
MTPDHNERYGVNQRKICVAGAVAAVLAALTFPAVSAQIADQFTFTPQRVTVSTDTTSGTTVCSLERARTKGWVRLHRPDGEVVHIKTDQIVFVMSATGTGAAQRAHSRIQLLNGFSDVRESVEEVMYAIQSDASRAEDGTPI